MNMHLLVLFEAVALFSYSIGYHDNRKIQGKYYIICSNHKAINNKQLCNSREREREHTINLSKLKFFVPDLLEKFLKTNQTSWRHTNSVLKSSRISGIRVDILSTYVLNESKNSKYRISIVIS